MAMSAPFVDAPLRRLPNGTPTFRPVLVAADRCKGWALCIDACAPGALALDTGQVNAMGHHPVSARGSRRLHQLRQVRADVPRRRPHDLRPTQGGLTVAVLDHPGGRPAPPRHRLAAGDRRRGVPPPGPRPHEGQRGDRRGRDRRRVRRLLRLPDHPAGGAAGVDGAPHAGGGPRLRPGGERARRDQHGARRRGGGGQGPRLQLQPRHQPHGRGDVLHGRVAAARACWSTSCAAARASAASGPRRATTSRR